ncbi:hypothetical protein PGT21_009478 [Puccinia graminis f. sp. tritici]|uniref:Uncharacterized protein n=1 Tax=Puccinia graminis f. sp. tritici TaxID=56615 RepID=A0A5B0PGF4_PUCGR|nr:hypothetical protein PGT21_009478 [Puccinia graminis f. sp. tritici]
MYMFFTAENGAPGAPPMCLPKARIAGSFGGALWRALFQKWCRQPYPGARVWRGTEDEIRKIRTPMGTAVGGIFWAAVPKCGIGTQFRDRGGDALIKLSPIFNSRDRRVPLEIQASMIVSLDMSYMQTLIANRAILML